MDAELYTVWDAIMFYLLYFRHLIFGLLLLLDIYLFTKWREMPILRIPAVLLGLCLLGAVVWWYYPAFS